jgi:hypothetical protein
MRKSTYQGEIMSSGVAVISSEAISKEELDAFVMQAGGYRGDKFGVHLAKDVAHISISIDNSVLSATLLGDAPEEYQRVTQELAAKPETCISIEIGGRESQANLKLAFEFALQCMARWHCILMRLDESYFCLTQEKLSQMVRERRTFYDMDIEKKGDMQVS